MTKKENSLSIYPFYHKGGQICNISTVSYPENRGKKENSQLKHSELLN
jgi:hypothetical protein